MSLSVALALCCAGAPAAVVTPLEELFTPADYPIAAREAGQSGDVAVQLWIGTNGRVEGCTVLRSSGAASLDSATCRILRSRGRFGPPRGPSGAPLPSQLKHVQHWALPAS